MSHPDYLSRYIAPSCFVGVKRNEAGHFEEVTEAFDWRTLDGGAVLAAFTEREWCRDFYVAHCAGVDPAPPTPLTLDVFALADVLGDLQAKGLKEVAFDPQAPAPGEWGRPWQVLTVGYCRRLAREMRPHMERLFAEKAAELGGGLDDFEFLAKVKELCAPFVHDIVQDAHARTAEWEICGPQPGQRPRGPRVDSGEYPSADWS